MTLPAAASAVQLDIYDATGSLVRTLVAGAQSAGTRAFSWDGLNDAGKALPDGAYSINAKVTAAGKTSIIPVNMTSTVKSVSNDPMTKDLTLIDQSGLSIPLSSVISFGH